MARNPIDGGQITWLLQKGIIKHIQAFDRGYFPEDNVLLMNVEFGMANQYILDLSKNVKRGMKTKAEKGWKPGLAPLGYLNDRPGEKGSSRIINDPERFDLVKKMWEMMLTGAYTPPAIADIANRRWNLRNPNGKPLIRSSIYELFSNPFYSGWYEFPKCSGNWFKGSHEAMITPCQYEKVQILIGKKGTPRRKKLEFAFTRLIRCGECGAMVTAEEKNQVICSECKYKFSSNNISECPRCHTPVNAMLKPQILHYVYYHCSKQTTRNCTQGSISVNELELQIDLFLSRAHISEGFKAWAIKRFLKDNERETISRESILSVQRKAYDSCLKKLDNLFQLKISPSNSNGSLLSDEEYGNQKAELLKEKARLEEILNDNNSNVEKWLNRGEAFFDFVCYARYWLENGTPKDKFEILRAIGSNLTMRDKKLALELHYPFVAIGELTERVPESRKEFKPDNIGLNKEDLEAIFYTSPIVSPLMDSLRTWLWNNLDNFFVPVLPKPPGEELLN